MTLFEAIQKDGRLSEEGLAQKIHIPATTVHYAMERIRQRDFFDIRAVPRLDRFGEIPLGIIGFADVHPVKVHELRQRYGDTPEVVQFYHDDRYVLLIVMESNIEALIIRLFDIMKYLDEKPCLYITSPVIAKNDVSTPDRILDVIYADLPDRRSKV